ncbi:MAG: GH116 family glycosyl-hydrolase, partial [bacterium]|nr:GH116 family glycosyl-hydrolase [bacterium]
MRWSRLLAFFLYGLLFCIPLWAQSSPEQNGIPTVGMPLGGIGTGVIELMPDGRFGQMTTQHNYHQPLHNPEGCFAAIYTSGGGTTVARRLAHGVDAGVERITFSGAYPFAEAAYVDSQLPLEVSLQAFSPLFPQDVDSSCRPLTLFVYKVKNISSQEQTVAMAMAWSNLVGLGGTAEKAFAPDGEANQEGFSRGRASGIRFQFNGKTTDPQEQNALGEAAFGVIEQNGDSISSLPQWDPQGGQAAFWSDFAADGAFALGVKGSHRGAVSGGQRPAAAVAAQRKLKPGQETVFVFFYTWYMPHLISLDGTDYGVYYTKFNKSVWDGVDTAAKDWEPIQQKMNAWRSSFTNSSIPDWLLQRMMNGMSILASSCIALGDGRFAFLTGDTNYPGNLGALDERLGMMPFLMQWYPSIFVSELDQFTKAQLADGEVPCAVGNIYTQIGTGDVPGGFLSRPDSAGAFVLMVYSNYLRTGVGEFLKDKYLNVRSAILWMITKDTDGDAIPDGASMFAQSGEGVTNLFSADLWLAVLKIGEEMGQWFRDPEFQSQCRDARLQAQANLLSELWNGTFLQAAYHAQDPLASDAGHLVGGSLPGEWFAFWHGWNPLLGHEYVAKTAQAMVNQLSHEDTGILFANHPGYTMAFTPALLARLGYSAAAEQAIRALPMEGLSREARARTEIGLWSYYDTLTGFSLDTHRDCLVMGPTVPLRQSSYSFPFMTEAYSGQLTFRRSIHTGQQRCDLRVTQIARRTDLELKQIAFKLPENVNANDYVLRVMVNGAYVAGQDFSRENLRVFGFEKFISIEEGDDLTLLLAPKNAGRLRLDLAKSNPTNLGTRCSIENFIKNEAGFRFDLTNLLSEQQMIFLEITGVDQKAYHVFLNGEPIPTAITAMEPLPMVLGTSVMPLDKLEWYRFAERACGEVAIQLAQIRGKNELRRRLWDYHEAIKHLLTLDLEQRGFTVDVVSSEFLSKRPDTPKSKETNIPKAITAAEKAEAAFLGNLDRLAEDPILASELAGSFVPLLLTAKPGEVDEKSGVFSVEVVVQNPLQSPVRSRVSLVTPQNWTVTTNDNTAFDEREDPGKLHRIRFSVKSQGNLMTQRQSITVQAAGTWGTIPYRKNVPLGIGHQFIHRWLVIGPFSNQKGEGLDYTYPPEMNVKPEEEYDGVNGKVKWETKEFADGYIDFDKVYDPDDYTAAYAYVGIYAPQERMVRLELGCNGDAKIFLNYKPIYKKRNINGMRPGSERVVTRLYQGWNHLLVKISERTGPWGFYFELTDINGQVM